MSFDQRINESTNQRINESTNQRINGPHANIHARYMSPPGMSTVSGFLWSIISNRFVYLLRGPILLLSLLVVSAGVAIFIFSSIVWLAITLMSIGGITALMICALVAYDWTCVSIGKSRVASCLKKIDADVKSEEDKLALDGKAHKFEFLDLFPERQNLAQGSMAKELIVSPLIRKLEREKVVYSVVREFNKLSLPEHFRGLDRILYGAILNYFKCRIIHFASVIIAENNTKDKRIAYNIVVINMYHIRSYISGLCESNKEAERNFGKFLFDSSTKMFKRCAEVTNLLIMEE